MNGGKFLEGFFGQSSKKEEQPPVVGGKQSKQQLQKTIKKQLKQLKQQGGASALSFSEYSAVPQNAVVPDANASTGAATESFARATMRGGQDGENAPAAVGDLMKGFMKAGSKLSKDELANFSSELSKLQQQKQQGGVGMNEIIVPLILLYASQKYSQGKTARNAARPMRRTMRRSRRFRR
jgi:hypothetical protein